MLDVSSKKNEDFFPKKWLSSSGSLFDTVWLGRLCSAPLGVQVLAIPVSLQTTTPFVECERDLLT